MSDSIRPSEAIEQVRSTPPGSTLIVDLDHTLHLGNSTEEYIDLAFPATIAATGLSVLEAVRPWRWRRDPVASRDHWRVVFVTMLLPWTLWRWRRRNRTSQTWNEPLLAAVEEHAGRGPVVVASNGYRMTVGPRVHRRLPDVEVIARGLLTRGPRHDDKAERVIEHLGPEVVAQSTVITDSEDDAVLLDACRLPVLLTWPDSDWHGALRSAYVPLRYTAAKHGKRSLLWTILLDDLPLIVLVTAISAQSPVRATLSVLAMLLALRSVYDSGYNENDHLKRDSEPSPNVRDEAHEHRHSVPSLPVFGWAVTAASFSVAMANPADLIAPFDDGSSRRWWALLAAFSVLATLRVVFAVFNRLAVSQRRWVHPLIQLARYGVFVATFSITGVGRVALLAQLVYRIVPYAIYRSPRSADRYPSGPWAVIRLLVFLAVAPLALPISGRESAVGAAVLVWLTLRSRRDLRRLLRNTSDRRA